MQSICTSTCDKVAIRRRTLYDSLRKGRSDGGEVCWAYQSLPAEGLRVICVLREVYSIDIFVATA